MATIKNWHPNTLCKIVHEGGQVFLTDPSGYRLPGQIWSRVTQNMTEPAYAIVKIRVEPVDTKDIESNEPENKEELNACTCGAEAVDPHPCPFREDVRNDSETLCACCPDCEYQCKQDI